MGTRSKRAAVAVLALSAALVGCWAVAAPRSFFTSFPLPGHHWVAAAGPFDEHLIRDVGALYLALCVFSVRALVRAHAESFTVTGVAWLVFSVPHLIFHAAHLDVYGTADAVGNVVGLGGTVVLAGLLLVPMREARRAHQSCELT